MSPEPYQPDYKAPEEKYTTGADLASLQSAATVAPKEKAPEKTDFDTLVRGKYDHVKRTAFRTATDYLIDGLTPLLIFVMVFTFLFFLLDVRYIYTEVGNANLRVFAFCIVMGVVALNRLIARDGSEESILYIFALGGAVAFYTFCAPDLYQGVSEDSFLSNPYLCTALNMVIVAFVWWLCNRLTHECCIDENHTAGDVGILTGTARKFQAAI
jgi:hypothetical protein